MSPVVDCCIKQESDIKPLTVSLSPLSSDSSVSDVACRSVPACNHFNNVFPSCSLSRALGLFDLSPEDMPAYHEDPLSVSCFTDVHLDTIAADDDLTSLDWLQDINLLRNISPDRQHCSDSNDDSFQDENTPTLPYHPERNPCGKPPYSFSVLIFMAIEASPHRRLPVKGIYEWIAGQFPFYRQAPSGWRNSVRHNLSLNKCFSKVEKAFGKGSSWCVDPHFRPNLLQAMRRTPYFPYLQIQMTSTAAADVFQDDCITEDLDDDECETSANGSLRQAEVVHVTLGEVDMDVAATLASLGNVRTTAGLSAREQKLLKIRSVENLPELVCTPPPSKDHSYGFAEWLIVEAQQTALAIECDVESPVDEVYDFGEIYCDSEVPLSDSSEMVSDVESRSSRSPKCRAISRHAWIKPEDDFDEEQRRLEGVRALMNLASGMKVDRRKKSRRLPESGPIWAKAVSACLKKRNERLGKAQKKGQNKNRVRNRKKIVRKRAK